MSKSDSIAASCILRAFTSFGRPGFEPDGKVLATKMLTWEELERHRSAHRFEKYLAGQRETEVAGRCLYMLPNVYDDIQRKQWPAARDYPPLVNRRRRSSMRLVLERYCRGRTVNLNEDLKELGTRDSNQFMRGLWEFRSGPPREQTRLFGYFARPGGFVAVSFTGRGNFEEQEDWDNHKIFCDGEWHTTFPQHDFLMDPWIVDHHSKLSSYLDRSYD